MASPPPADAPPRAQGFELMCAIAQDDAALVRALLQRHAPPARAALANFCDYDRRTPLHLACADGRAPIARALLAAGADPAARDRFGATCVADALTHGRINTLRVLAKAAAPFPAAVQPALLDPAYGLGRDLLTVAAVGSVRAAQQLVRTFGANGT